MLSLALSASSEHESNNWDGRIIYLRSLTSTPTEFSFECCKQPREQWMNNGANKNWESSHNTRWPTRGSVTQISNSMEMLALSVAAIPADIRNSSLRKEDIKLLQRGGPWEEISHGWMGLRSNTLHDKFNIRVLRLERHYSYPFIPLIGGELCQSPRAKLEWTAVFVPFVGRCCMSHPGWLPSPVQ